MSTQIPLPELPQASIDRIEKAVFADIARETAPATPSIAARRSVRRRRWLTGLGVAAAFVAGVMVAPPVLSAMTGIPVNDASSLPITAPDIGDAGAGDAGVREESGGATVGGAPTIPSRASSAASAAAREIIAHAQAVVVVGDIPDAVSALGDLANKRGGYVESTNLAKEAVTDASSTPVRPDRDQGWIAIRVPAAELPAAIKDLAKIGTVRSSSISKEDATTAAIDLRARVKSLQASVDRLTELMSQSGAVSDLIAAEVALTERQAELESYQQQLKALEEQVVMSSLQVQLVRERTAAEANPTGFGDGLLAGWNGLVVSMNALVIALGFVLPWLAVAAVVVLIVWVGRRRRRPRGDAEPA